MGDAATDAGIDAAQRRLMFEEEAKYSSTSRRRLDGEAVEDNDHGTRRDWAGGLPEGILDMISDRLSVGDCASFADVCISWSKVIKEQSQQSSFRGFPLLLMGSGQRFRYTKTCLTSLDNFTSCWGIDMPEAYMKYFWGSFHDWLILVGVLKRFGLSDLICVKLYNPFSRVTIDLPETFNRYTTLVASSRPSDPNFVCILLPFTCCGYVDFWAPGLDKWHKCSGLSGLELVDAVFCGTARTGVVGLRYLVESQGEVLLVCRVSNQGTFETKEFVIHKLDVCEMAWRKVENLGDRVLFLGRGCSRSFSALDLEVEKANCIYFTNDWRPSVANQFDLSQDILVKYRKKLEIEAPPSTRQGTTEGIEGLEKNSDWGIFSLNPEDLGHFTFPPVKESNIPIWLTAPLSSYCRGGTGFLNYM
ncbi:hypothetical protein RHMOL_Rhmol07G0053900 [Rhododendron molle]|uniref:Uncharacterized protein n=1 Tax=Rhododendron molle TaxID=49168 RepID=A0ACC0MYQ0_RHOML|nr:hypothetical protein RHMOL_Rhmol07G0053900 [Rhododendron molle]